MLQDQIHNQKRTLSFSRIQNYLFRSLLFLLPLTIFPFPWDWTERGMSILILLFSTLILVIELLKLIWEGRTSILKSALDIGLFLLLFTMLVSTLFSVDINTSLWGVDHRLSSGLISFFSVLLVTIVSRTFLDTEDDLKHVILFFAAGLLVNNFLSTMSFFGINIWSFIPVYKSLYIEGSPLVRSMSVHLLLNFVNLFLCISLIGEHLIKKQKISQLIFGAFSGVVSVLNIILFSLSQGLFIVLLSVVVLLLFSIFLIKKARLEKETTKELLILSLVTTALILIPVSLLQIPSIRNNVVPEDFNLLTEVTLGSQISWIISSSVLISSLGRAIVGLGMDTFSVAYHLYRPMDIGLLLFNDITFYKAGGEIFTQLANGGLLWLLAWLFFGYLIGKSFWVDLKQIKLKKDIINSWRLVIINTIIILIYLSSFFVSYSIFVVFTLLFLISIKAIIKNLLDKDDEDKYVIKFWTVDLKARNSMKPYASNLNVLLSIVVIIAFGGLSTLWLSKGLASAYTLRTEAYLNNELSKYQEVEPTVEERKIIVQKLIELRARAVGFDRNNPQYIRSLALMNAERLVLDVEEYSEIIRQSEGEPETAESDTMIANIMAWRNNALELSKKSISISPYIYANKDVNSRLQMLFVELGVSDDREEVMLSIDRALELNPINYNLHFNKAQIFLLKEDMESSLVSLSDVLTINPYHIPSIILVANIKKEMGDMETYEAYLKAAKKILEDEGLTDIDIYHEISLELNNISDGRELTGDSSKEPESIEIPEYSEEDQIDLGLKELQKDNSYILE